MASKVQSRRSVRPKKKPSAKSKAQFEAASGKRSKLDTIVALLSAPKGASLQELERATGWQRHSVRGAISGALKKKRALTVTTATRDGERIYRIEGRK